MNQLRVDISWRWLGDLERAADVLNQRIGADVDCFVGVPASGLLLADMLNKRRSLAHVHITHACLVDDSIDSGRSMRAMMEYARHRFEWARISTATAYATDSSAGLVDFWAEVLPHPRMFEWNWHKNENLKFCAIDLDGILCRDPTEEENDDGHSYRVFLTTTLAHQLDRPVGWIITSRLEKYRRETETWLACHDIRYGKLIMLDLPNKAARERMPGGAAKFKADAYQEQTTAGLFIESDDAQAMWIHKITGLPTICLTTGANHG